MTRKLLRIAAILLALTGLTRPAAAQRPAPEATPRACDDCDSLDALHAQLDARRAELQRRYDAAAEAWESMQQKDDSASHAAYAQARRELERARRAFNEAANGAMRVAAERMQHDAQHDMEMMRGRMKIMRERMPKGWLGVTFSGSFEIIEDSGRSTMRFSEYPTIESVDPDSPADKAGVESRDVLLAIDRADVTKGTPSFAELLRPGRSLTLKLKRGRSTMDRVVLVEKRPEEWTPMPAMAPRAPRPAFPPDAPEPPDGPEIYIRTPLPPGDLDPERMPGGVTVSVYGVYDNAVVAGAEVQKFEELKAYFGADSGVLVLHVLPGTPAARAGLKGGDVIVRADGRTVTAPLQFAKLVGRANGRPLTIEIVRQRKKQTVTLK